MTRFFTFAMQLALWLPSIGVAQPLPWPAGHQTHRAIFCAFAGHSETTSDYAQALLAELKRLETRGLVDSSAWARLHEHAQCAKGPAWQDSTTKRRPASSMFQEQPIAS